MLKYEFARALHGAAKLRETIKTGIKTASYVGRRQPSFLAIQRRSFFVRFLQIGEELIEASKIEKDAMVCLQRKKRKRNDNADFFPNYGDISPIEGRVISYRRDTGDGVRFR